MSFLIIKFLAEISPSLKNNIMTTHPSFNEPCPYTYNGEIIHWFTRPTIEFQFDAINQHLDFLKKSMEQEKDNRRTEANKFVDKLDVDDDEKYEIFVSILEGKYFSGDCINAFEQIQWRSNFIVLYSVFDHILNLICYVVGKELNIKYNGDTVAMAKEYLGNKAKVKIPTEQWDRVILLRDIRNVLVHRNGELDRESKDERHINQVKNITKNIIEGIKLTHCIDLINGISDDVIYDENKHEILLTYEFVKQSVDELKNVVMAICDYQLYADKS